MKRWLKAIAFFLLFLLIYISGYVDYSMRSQEVVLQRNLWTMRRAIDLYWQDRSRPPQSLQELISASYLREIPVDPLTKSNQTWIIEREDGSSVLNTPPGIIDLRSAAAGADKNGKPYNRY